jgi:hypothetical protein
MQNYTQPTIDIKQLFSLMPVKTLREIATKHNVQTSIKAPSQMLKAELVKSLSNHYVSLVGNSLYPLPSKNLDIPYTDIPEKWKPKKAPKELTEKEKALKEWVKGIVRVKKTPYELAKERREERALMYATEKKTKEAITRREKRQEKAKEARQKKKEEEKKSNITKKVVKPEKEEEEDHPFIEKLNKFYDRVKYLKNIEPDERGKDYYSATSNKFDDISFDYNKIKNSLTKNNKDKANKIFDKISSILDDDDIIDKFS